MDVNPSGLSKRGKKLVEEDERGADERKETQKVYIGKEEFVFSDLETP